MFHYLKSAEISFSVASFNFTLIILLKVNFTYFFSHTNMALMAKIRKGCVQMGILGGNPKDEPLHYGEVFSVWSGLIADYGMISGYQTFYNHAGDEDLKNY